MSTKKTIAKSFTVSTIEDGVSVQAQYAPDANPTSGQIHTVWQDGDLYMRTKMTNETTWSDWHLIVGENGGETDYSFAISSQLSSTSSSNPPSDCTSESSWHDTPQAVTTQKPYLWMRVKKKVWNKNTQQYDVSSTSYARLSAESNYIADLDNEMDSIECNNLGYPKSAQTISTKATLYRGSTLLSSTISVYDDDTSGAQYTNGTAKDGITISWANATGVINVAFATSTIRTEKEVFCIKLTATDSGQTIARLLYLTVNCVRGTALYRLVPSTDTITKRKNGTRVPSGNITCDVQKIVNGVISTPAASEYSLKMKVDDGSEGDYDTVAVSNITSSIEYILRVPQTSGTIVDRERVPLLIDGNDGLNAFVVDLENEMTNVALDENGDLIANFDMYFKVRAYYGTTNVLSDSACSVSASCSDPDVTVTDTNAKTTGIRVQISSGTHILDTTEVSVTVTHTAYGTRTVIFTLAGICAGENAVIQELIPSLDAISFARQDDGSLSPTNRSLSLSIKKTQGGVTTIQTIGEANLTIRWSASSMPTTSSGGNNWGNGTATGITWDNITMKIASGVEASNVYIAMFNSSGTLLDRETIPIIKDGKHGKNAFTVDLENEMKNVALTEGGNTLTAVDFYFKVQAFYGTTNVLSDNECTVSASCSDSNVTLTTTAAKTTGIRVQVEQNVSLANSTDIIVTVAHTTYGTRTVIFTLAGVRGGANAVLQELLPSLDSISFARTAAGGLTPSSRDLSLSIKKTQGGSTSTQSISECGLIIRWSSTSMPASKTGGNGWGNGTATGISWNNITMQIANTVAATNIYISAFNSDGTLVDRETIPVIKDGNNGADGNDGDDGVSYCFVFTKAAARVNENNIVTAELAGYAYKYVGGVRSALTSTTIRYGYILTDFDTYANTTTNSSGFFDTGTWFNGDDITNYGKNSPSIFAAIVIDGTVVHAEMITISVKGNTGNRGKVGRFFYYAGDWNDFASTDSFLVNDAQAPYFYYNNNYWVFNPETNGTYTKQNMGTPSASSSNWKLMTSDFKYIITEAIFGSYAHFGGAIINGDYLMSQYGYMLGFCNTKTPINDNTQYQNVDMGDVLGDDDMYDPTKLIWNDSSQMEITSTTYTTITSASFVQNRYYTFEIDENTEVSGNEMLWTIVTQSGTEIAGGTIISTSTGTNKNCVNFKSTVSATCYLRVKITNRNNTVVIDGFYLRFAKFIPYLAMDLLSGKFVANNIIARGELHADSLYYTMVNGNSNDDRFTMNDESIVNLGTRAVGTTVILPSPSSCKGRVVELFNHATRFYATWVGAYSTSSFSAAYGSGLGIRVIDSMSYQYVKFYCDGTNWWILKAEV